MNYITKSYNRTLAFFPIEGVLWARIPNWCQFNVAFLRNGNRLSLYWSAVVYEQIISKLLNKNNIIEKAKNELMSIIWILVWLMVQWGLDTFFYKIYWSLTLYPAEKVQTISKLISIRIVSDFRSDNSPDWISWYVGFWVSILNFKS